MSTTSPLSLRKLPLRGHFEIDAPGHERKCGVQPAERLGREGSRWQRLLPGRSIGGGVGHHLVPALGINELNSRTNRQTLRSLALEEQFEVPVVRAPPKRV